MENNNGDTVAGEAGKRLDDLFGEAAAQGNEAPAVRDGDGEESGDRAESGGAPTGDLKEILLSMDWEIDDRIMERLMAEIERLKGVFEDDRIPLMFLRLMGSAGKYVKIHKAGAHPAAVRLLSAVYGDLETILSAGEMTEAEKKRILLSRVKEFKELKAAIDRRRAGSGGKGPAPSGTGKGVAGRDAVGEDTVSAPPPALAPHEAFAMAVEEIKDLIRAEFRAIRAELKLWRDAE